MQNLTIRIFPFIYKKYGISQYCGPGSGRIGIVLTDPDPFQPKVNLNYTFSRKFQNTVQIIENYITPDAYENDITM